MSNEKFLDVKLNDGFGNWKRIKSGEIVDNSNQNGFDYARLYRMENKLNQVQDNTGSLYSPNNFRLVKRDHSLIRLEWNHNTNNPSNIIYEIYRTTDTPNNEIFAGKMVYRGKALFFEDSDVASRHEYEYRIYTINLSNNKYISTTPLKVGKSELRIMNYIIDESKTNTNEGTPSLSSAYYSIYKNIGIYPCIVKNGKEIYKLNDDNFNLIKNGGNLNLNDDTGDVMIKFPIMGIKIFRTEPNYNTDYGKIVFINIVLGYDKELEKEGYSYNAHRDNNGEIKDLYVGSYFSSLVGDKLRSLPNKKLYLEGTLTNNIAKAKNNNPKCNVLDFFQDTLISALSILLNGGRYLRYTLGNSRIYSSVHTSLDSMSKGMNKVNSNTVTSNVKYNKFLGFENYFSSIPFYIGDCQISNNHIIIQKNDIKYSMSYDTSKMSGGHSQRNIMCGEFGFLPREITSYNEVNFYGSYSNIVKPTSSNSNYILCKNSELYSVPSITSYKSFILGDSNNRIASRLVCYI